MAHVHFKKTQSERDCSMLKNMWDFPLVRVVTGRREQNAWERLSPGQNAWKGKSLEGKVVIAENLALRAGALGAGALGAGALAVRSLEIKHLQAVVNAQDKRNSKMEATLAGLREDVKKAKKEGYDLGYNTKYEEVLREVMGGPKTQKMYDIGHEDGKEKMLEELKNDGSLKENKYRIEYV